MRESSEVEYVGPAHWRCGGCGTSHPSKLRARRCEHAKREPFDGESEDLGPVPSPTEVFATELKKKGRRASVTYSSWVGCKFKGCTREALVSVTAHEPHPFTKRRGHLCLTHAAEAASLESGGGIKAKFKIKSGDVITCDVGADWE